VELLRLKRIPDSRETGKSEWEIRSLISTIAEGQPRGNIAQIQFRFL
jgi:hypothetical protein